MSSILPPLTEQQFNDFFNDLKESFEEKVNKNKLNSLKDIIGILITEKKNYRKIILNKDKDQELYKKFIDLLNSCIKNHKILNNKNIINYKKFKDYSNNNVNIYI